MVTIKVHELNSLIEKSFGLIFAKRAYPVLLQTRFGIHTFGMHFPIDVILLDNDQIVVKLWESVYPNRIIVYPFKYTQILELPEGMIQSTNITIGKKIKLVVS